MTVEQPAKHSATVDTSNAGFEEKLKNSEGQVLHKRSDYKKNPDATGVDSEVLVTEEFQEDGEDGSV
jgi:hypothetical protein